MKMQHLSQWRQAFVCLVTVSATVLSASAGTYSVKDLGPVSDLAGRSDGRPNGINLSGAVAAANVTNGSYQAFLYGGSWKDLGTLGGDESQAAGLNDSGRVVGYSQISSGEMHAFLWTAGGTDGVSGNPQMKDLGTLGGANSQAAAINGTGQMTGYSDVPGQVGARQQAFVYSGGKMVNIGKSVSSLPNSFGYGINSAGHVAGTAYDAGYAAPHAFFYDGKNGVDIGALGGEGATALAINDSDWIAGYSTTTNSVDHAFIYAGSVMTDIGTLGGHYSYGIGINNHNVVVGGSFADKNDSVYHAFVWANNLMQDLNAQLDSTGAGWTLAEARAINDAGQIVGTGTFGGVNHAFLLTPNTGGGGVTSPKITSVRVSGKNLVLSFQSASQATYSLLGSPSLVGGSWSNLVSGILGNGGIVTVTNVNGASLPNRFYRVEASGQ